MQPVTHVSFYLDWSFWTVIVAFLALILSQLPPLYTFLKSAQLDLELYAWIHLTHKVGNPNLQLHFILTNVGGGTARVKEATLTITRDSKEVATISARNYLQNPNDKTGILFTPFSLKSKEEWAHIVNFFNYLSRDENKKFRNAESKLKNDIAKKLKSLKDKEKLAEAENGNVVPFNEMFDSNFIWFPGEYELNVNILTIPENAGINKDYRFTLFESDSQDLSKSKEDYKTGDGINWDSGKHPGVIVQITEA